MRQRSVMGLGVGAVAVGLLGALAFWGPWSAEDEPTARATDSDTSPTAEARPGLPADDAAATEAADPEGQDPEPTATPTDEPAADPTDDPAAHPTVLPDIAASVPPAELAEAEPADVLVEPYVEVLAGALAGPEEASPDEMVTVAGGTALDSIRASVAEYEANEWTQVGAPELVSSSIQALDADAAPPTAEVVVCLEHADVDVVDSLGESVVDPDAPTRIQSVLELEFLEGRWVLTAQTFGDELSC